MIMKTSTIVVDSMFIECSSIFEQSIELSFTQHRHHQTLTIVSTVISTIVDDEAIELIVVVARIYQKLRSRCGGRLARAAADELLILISEGEGRSTRAPVDDESTIKSCVCVRTTR